MSGMEIQIEESNILMLRAAESEMFALVPGVGGRFKNLLKRGLEILSTLGSEGVAGRKVPSEAELPFSSFGDEPLIAKILQAHATTSSMTSADAGRLRSKVDINPILILHASSAKHGSKRRASSTTIADAVSTADDSEREPAPQVASEASAIVEYDDAVELPQTLTIKNNNSNQEVLLDSAKMDTSYDKRKDFPGKIDWASLQAAKIRRVATGSDILRGTRFIDHYGRVIEPSIADEVLKWVTLKFVWTDETKKIVSVSMDDNQKWKAISNAVLPQLDKKRAKILDNGSWIVLDDDTIGLRFKDKGEASHLFNVFYRAHARQANTHALKSYDAGVSGFRFRIELGMPSYSISEGDFAKHGQRSFQGSVFPTGGGDGPTNWKEGFGNKSWSNDDGDASGSNILSKARSLFSDLAKFIASEKLTLRDGI